MSKEKKGEKSSGELMKWIEEEGKKFDEWLNSPDRQKEWKELVECKNILDDL